MKLSNLAQNSVNEFIPFMNTYEIEAIVSLLKTFHQPVKILEWGSGNSTLYFPFHVASRSEWISIEHQAGWAEKTRNAITQSGNERIRVYHIPNTEEPKVGEDGDYDGFRDYILFPTSLGNKFDVILVDGRARVECMQIGWMLLDRRGLMILHDAQRARYKRGIPPDCFYLRLTNPQVNVEGPITLLLMTKSPYTIIMVLDILKNTLPDFIIFESDNYSSSISKSKLSWEKVRNLPNLKLYAGDIPDYIEYEGVIGLSLTRNDYRHIKHDITLAFPLPDNSVDMFQAEDCLEYIPYQKLVPVIDEIFRILKPNGLFRLSVPDYACDVLQARSIKDSSGNIIFDPGGGGTIESPGHLWFPRLDNVESLLGQTKFFQYGKIIFLHYYRMDNSFVATRIDYSKGYMRRTPDNDERVQSPYRPLSMVVDLIKRKSDTL